MIIDLKRFAIGDIFNHKKLIAELFTHYPCRLGKIYLLRGNKTLNGLSKLIPQNTLVKVSWIEAKSEMLNFFNPQQLETRFGGSALNLKSFWPPVVPNSSFRAANDCIQDFLSNFSVEFYKIFNTKIDFVEFEIQQKKLTIRKLPDF